MKLVKNENELKKENISDKEAEEAFIKILKWMGEDPSREGLIETPKRVMKAFKEYFKGYNEDGKKVLEKTLKAGARFIWLDVFSSDLTPQADPVISNGIKTGNWQLTLNTIPFDDCMKVLGENAFRSGKVYRDRGSTATAPTGCERNGSPAPLGHHDRDSQCIGRICGFWRLW